MQPHNRMNGFEENRHALLNVQTPAKRENNLTIVTRQITLYI